MVLSKYLAVLIILNAILILFCPVARTQNCYQSYLENASSHKVKFIGSFKDQPLYQEILSFHNGTGTSLNIVLLRKDTGILKDFDFCFEFDGDLRVEVSKLDQDSSSNPTYSLNDMEDIYQILHAQLNYAWLDNENTKIVLKRNKLYLKYTTGSCISDCPNYAVVEKYKFNNGKFEFVKLTKRKT